jgi:hypothetical protein
MNLPLTLPFTLPDWLPAWVFLLLALPVLLWLLAFALMPFNVFGVKSRLEALEAQVDALQEELRTASVRTGGYSRARVDEYEDVPNFGRLKAGQNSGGRTYDPVPNIPPIPPAPLTPVPKRVDAPVSRLPARPARRMEPRLD